MGQAQRVRIWAAEAAEKSQRRLDAAVSRIRTGNARRDFSAAGRIFGVVRVHADGRREFASSALTYHQADVLAGKMRDAMTDAEVEQGYTYGIGKRGHQSEHKPPRKTFPGLP